MSTEVIVALDVPTLEEEKALIQKLRGSISFFKVGLQLFTAHGRAAVDVVKQAGGRVFLDLKLHDIPQTVALAVAETAKLGVDSVSLHSSGGAAMLRAAAAVPGRPKLWGVTVLTSMTEADLGVFHDGASLPKTVENLARQGRDCGLEATICSPNEVEPLRRALGAGAAFVTPGIRPTGAELGDQRRVMTPAQAAALGIGHIVVGRPITHAKDPRAAADAVLGEIAGVGGKR